MQVFDRYPVNHLMCIVPQGKSQTVADIASLHKCVCVIYIFRLGNLGGAALFPLPGHSPQRFVPIRGLLDGLGMVQNVCKGGEGYGRYGLRGGTDSPIKVNKAVSKDHVGATRTRCQALTSCPSSLPQNRVSGLDDIIDVCAT